MNKEQFNNHFSTKKIKGKWYCYGTWEGYDHSFCSDNEQDAIDLAKTKMKVL